MYVKSFEGKNEITQILKIDPDCKILKHNKMGVYHECKHMIHLLMSALLYRIKFIFSKLTELIYLQVLSENKIGNQGVIALCAVLCRSDMICKLDLSGR